MFAWYLQMSFQKASQPNHSTMRKYLTKRVLTTNLALFFITLMIHAQDLPPYENPAYGADSASRISCAADLSTMSEYIKIDMPEYALPAWRNVFLKCPASSKNIYIAGVRIFRKKIEETGDPALKSAYFDTLMMNYDRRIEYFGEEGYVLGRKGIDIIRYNDKAFDQAYEAFLKSARVSGPDIDINVLVGLAQTGVVMMKAGKIDATTFLNNYLLCRDLLDQERSQGGNPAKFDRVSEAIDKIVAGAGIQDCDVIANVLSDRVDTAEADPKLLQVAANLLSSSGCVNSPFYASVNEALLKLSPDAGRAYELARYNIKKEQYAKAAGYLTQAINAEDDPAQKATYQYQLALIDATKLEKYQEARDEALKAIENKPGWGEPYFVIASAYISGVGSCGGEDFDKKAIYWLAVDYCQKAKQVDNTSEQKANELISQYKSNYPSVEDSFFRSLKEGDVYRFNCWIKESTTVKIR